MEEEDVRRRRMLEIRRLIRGLQLSEDNRTPGSENGKF